MKSKIYRSRLLSLFILGVISGVVLLSCAGKPDPQPKYITELDHLIDNKDEYEQEKLLRIDLLRQKLPSAIAAPDRYSVNSLLFDEYYTYNSDSAHKYIDAAIAIARESGNPDWINAALMKKAELLTSTGLMTSARRLLREIDRASISPELLTAYYGDMIYLYSHLGNYAGGPYNDYYDRERLYKDSIMTVIDQAHPAYLWYKGLDILGTDKPTDETIAALEKKLAKSGLNSRQDAMDAFILAKLYQQAGDLENYRKNMALSASVDVRIANSLEISSLEELSHIMFDNGRGDIDRAYKYINYCLNKAISYPNRVKAFGISEVLENVSDAYQKRSRDQQRRTILFLVFTCVLAAVLAAAIIIIIRQNRKLKHQSLNLKTANDSLQSNIAELSETHRELNEANERLKQLIADLKMKNDELNEANYVKEEYIGSIFSICSNYIDKLAELKKSIHLRVLQKKYHEIENETEDFDMRHELKDFYRDFDTIFLHIYPDFVSDFNALLQPDKPIIPKEGELLNTELRIYALIRLGITDSVKIAEFLHCSPQTIYNNRFRVRNKAVIPKENFVETVRKLGTYIKSE